jgi:hypothetical protein
MTTGTNRSCSASGTPGVVTMALIAALAAVAGACGAAPATAAPSSATAAPSPATAAPSPATSAVTTVSTATETAPTTTIPATTAAATLLEDIPPGRGIAEGGGGPLAYTFREEWRKARVEARLWRPGAYLISGSGLYVNDDGVPSYWAFNFIDRPDADAVLKIQIDPWGTVTQAGEAKGNEIASYVGEFTAPIPYAVIDSDAAVRLGKAAIAARYDLDETKDPRLGLNFSALDGSGPYWQYTVFRTSSASYVTARIHALTGEATLVE